MFALWCSLLLCLSAGVHARPAAWPTPLDRLPLFSRDGTTALSAAELSSFAPFTQFARAAYCPTDKIMSWQCGEACDANPGFNATLTGGDGNGVQFFFVGFWPEGKSVVVAHQGTDPTKFLSLLTDIEFAPVQLDPTVFPGIPNDTDVRVHDGFRNAHYDTANQILTETKRLLDVNQAKSVILIGHSLGGAIAELDSLMMRQNLPSDVAVKGVTYGTPRVGNPEFAAYFDSMVTDFTRVNNDKDPIPIVPGRFLGFSHPSGEVHLTSPGNAVSCPGADDGSDTECSDSVVPNIFESNILDHLGPYEGIHIGSIFCN
ncbi:alpha/beta-hydrolase [Punctularia strigosozonata HHB-11173 SS5]|uniref:alpha/beta-hydrolase n=1 Tax=Punctularia strigosozonata (strain HHB-11173) TaxID=741275 RepID=UPI0004416447|nr:alpha/beta-hydrolase [Punctularia strigosozonata HHB-11173 SS5]EIN13713.1 alpha/beta-hydrolase [Punctularia strigosozonata HHB-11173 SS5]